MLKPIKNLVLVERTKEEDTTKGGIILPETSKSPSQWGKIKAIGPKVDELNVGDLVYFSKYAGTAIDDTQLVLKEEDVLGFVKSEDVAILEKTLAE